MIEALCIAGVMLLVGYMIGHMHGYLERREQEDKQRKFNKELDYNFAKGYGDRERKQTLLDTYCWWLPTLSGYQYFIDRHSLHILGATFTV